MSKESLAKRLVAHSEKLEVDFASLSTPVVRGGIAVLNLKTWDKTCRQKVH